MTKPSSLPKNDDYFKTFSKAGTDYKGNLRGTRGQLSGVTVQTITSLLQNTETNYATIGSYMEALYNQNGIVSRTLNYLMAHPTYNHNIYPLFTSDIHSEMTNDPFQYADVAAYLQKYNIKFFAPYFVKQTLINGMSFFYELEDKSGVSYLEFPLSMGRISGIENGVYRWMVDISKIKPEIINIPGFPKEIINAYETKERSDPKKWVDGKYYILSKKAVAFCFDMSAIRNGGVAVSEFAALLIDSVQVENAKDNVDIKDGIDTIRIVHAKIPTDKDGRPTVSPKQAAEWDSALKRALPNGIAGITNPFELSNIPLNGAGNQKAYSTVNDAQEQLFYSTGTPNSLFGGNTTSSQIVKISVLKDAAWVYTKILPVLENYYNAVLSNYKNKSGFTWKVKMLRQSYFTYDDDVKRYKDAVAVGGSRTDFLASLGTEPVEVYGKLIMEQQMLDIDSIMVPKSMSYTMSGKDIGENAGRPKTSDPTDDTDRINNAS